MPEETRNSAASQVRGFMEEPPSVWLPTLTKVAPHQPNGLCQSVVWLGSDWVVSKIDLDQNAFWIGHEQLRQHPAWHHALPIGQARLRQLLFHPVEIIAPEGDMVEAAGTLGRLGGGIGNDNFSAPGPVRRFDQMHHGNSSQIEPIPPKCEIRPRA